MLTSVSTVQEELIFKHMRSASYEIQAIIPGTTRLKHGLHIKDDHDGTSLIACQNQLQAAEAAELVRRLNLKQYQRDSQWVHLVWYVNTCFRVQIKKIKHICLKVHENVSNIRQYIVYMNIAYSNHIQGAIKWIWRLSGRQKPQLPKLRVTYKLHLDSPSALWQSTVGASQAEPEQDAWTTKAWACAIKNLHWSSSSSSILSQYTVKANNTLQYSINSL